MNGSLAIHLNGRVRYRDAGPCTSRVAGRVERKVAGAGLKPGAKKRKLGIGVGRVLSASERHGSRDWGEATALSRQQSEKERGSHLYAARAVDVNTEEGAAARVHRTPRERPPRPTTLRTRHRVHQLRGFPTQLDKPLHTRDTCHGRPLGPDRLGG